MFKRKDIRKDVILLVTILLISIRSIIKGFERDTMWQKLVCYLPVVVFAMLLISFLRKINKPEENK